MGARTKINDGAFSTCQYWFVNDGEGPKKAEQGALEYTFAKAAYHPVKHLQTNQNSTKVIFFESAHQRPMFLHAVSSRRLAFRHHTRVPYHLSILPCRRDHRSKCIDRLRDSVHCAIHRCRWIHRKTCKYPLLDDGRQQIHRDRRLHLATDILCRKREGIVGRMNFVSL